MLVTIYTDASYQPRNDMAGGAAWIRSEDGLIKYHNSFRADNSSHAEAFIALRAIQAAHEKWAHSKVMFVNTDNLSLCKCIWPFTNDSGKGEFGRTVRKIIKYCDEHNLETRFKHVKGHQNKDKDVRAFLNFWCDKNAGINRKNQTETITFGEDEKCFEDKD